MDGGESELLKLLAINLKQHFRQVVLLYQDSLFSFIARLTANDQEAEDIVQEGLLGAYVTLSHYPLERVQALKLRPWLYKIILNVWRNRRRGLRPHIIPLDGAISDVISVSEEEQPDALYELEERAQELSQHIASLPEQYRVVIVCYFFEALTYQDISDLLDVPIGTVKSRLHRGIQMLRQQLRPGSQERAESRRLAEGTR